VPYQLSGENHLFDWLEREPDPAAWDHMLAWVRKVCADPTSVAAEPVPGSRLQRFVARVPGTDAVVTYFYAVAPVRTVRIQRIARADDL